MKNDGNTKNTPRNGEWWMLKSKKTLRTSPMFKVKNGWCSILNNSGKPLQDFIQTDPSFDILYRLISEAENQKEYAIQQMVGFKQGKSDGCIESLASGMGLTKEEWIEIKSKEDGVLDGFDADVLDACLGVAL